MSHLPCLQESASAEDPRYADAIASALSGQVHVAFARVKGPAREGNVLFPIFVAKQALAATSVQPDRGQRRNAVVRIAVDLIVAVGLQQAAVACSDAIDVASDR